MAKSTKPRSTAHEASTTPRPARARKSAATPETTTFETATLNTASANTATLESTTPATPLRDLIAMRAYELFLRDGAAHGRDVEHWLRAERELRERASRN